MKRRQQLRQLCSCDGEVASAECCVCSVEGLYSFVEPSCPGVGVAGGVAVETRG